MMVKWWFKFCLCMILSLQILHLWITELGEDGVCFHLSVFCAVDRRGTNVILYNIYKLVSENKNWLMWLPALFFYFLFFIYAFLNNMIGLLPVVSALLYKSWLVCIWKELFSNWRLPIWSLVFNKWNIVFENASGCFDWQWNLVTVKVRCEDGKVLKWFW